VTETEKKSAVATLVAVCEAIADGQFEVMDDLFEIAGDSERPPDIRALAETFAGMVMKVEAREFRSRQLIADLKQLHGDLEAAHHELKREYIEIRELLRTSEAE
jgi:hypothetical protein